MQQEKQRASAVRQARMQVMELFLFCSCNMLNNFNCGLDNRLYTQQARSDATDTGINYRQPKYAQSGTYHTEYSHTSVN